MSTVRLAIVGVGNCASSLVQGIHYSKDAEPDSTVPGLMVFLWSLGFNLFGDVLRDVQDPRTEGR